MKRIALIGLLVWLTSCAPGDRSFLALNSRPIENTPASPTTRSVEQAPTRAPDGLPAPSLIVTKPIETAASVELAPTLTPIPIMQECPPLPAPSEVETPAAVQHFEHGLMLWLQERDEIWALIASPLPDQFYWRTLPNLWSEGQPVDDPKLQPPAGRFQPRRGFGVAWRLGGGTYGPQRADLGWAVDEEADFDTTLIYYPQGFYSPDCTWLPKSGIYELTGARGTVYQLVGAGGIAKIVRRNE